jgi:hypothetical protein
MPKETDIKRLEAKVVELENALKALIARKPVDLSADDIKAFLKVRNAVCCDIQNCGPGWSTCSCEVFNSCGNFWSTRCRCGFTCGRPCGCDIGYLGGGGLARFSDLGS